KPLVVVGAAVFRGSEVKAHVDERSDDEALGGGAEHVVQAERHAMTFEERVDPIVVPTGVAEFGDESSTCFLGRRFSEGGELVEEDLKSRDIDSPAGRELKQHRPESRLQMPRAVEEARQRACGVLQLLHMREEAARFDGVEEMRRGLLAPSREGT